MLRYSTKRPPARRRLTVTGKEILLFNIPVFLFQILYLHHKFLFSETSKTTITTTPVNVGRWSLLHDAPVTPVGVPPGQRNSTLPSALSNDEGTSTPRQIVGSFNGYPITHWSTKEGDQETSQMYSTLHCVGESYRPPFYWKRRRTFLDLTWQARSCHFQFFCYDLDNNDYVIFQDPNERTLEFSDIADVTQSIFTNSTPQTVGTGLSHAQTFPYKVSIGGINTKWTLGGSARLAWFPQIRTRLPDSFYVLPSNVAILPFHSLASFNPGHLIWDDFLPIFALLEVFHLEHLELLLMRYVLEGDGLWAGCDWKPERSKECTHMLQKFGPLMVRHPEALPISTQREPRLQLLRVVKNTTGHTATETRTNLVCAKHGLAGLGALTDHGPDKGHGWEEKDYEHTFNHGRAGQFWRFRNFMLANLGVPPPTDAPPLIDPLVIVISEMSSAKRGVNFNAQFQTIQKAFPDETVVRVESYRMHKYSLKEQAEIANRAAIYISVCGGGAMTATFLPRGSSVILFYLEEGGVESNEYTGKPARLDWDYFNNMGYARVHWFPQGIRNDDGNEALIRLIQHEVRLIQCERKEYDHIDG